MRVDREFFHSCRNVPEKRRNLPVRREKIPIELYNPLAETLWLLAGGEQRMLRPGEILDLNGG